MTAVMAKLLRTRTPGFYTPRDQHASLSTAVSLCMSLMARLCTALLKIALSTSRHLQLRNPGSSFTPELQTWHCQCHWQERGAHMWMGRWRISRRDSRSASAARSARRDASRSAFILTGSFAVSIALWFSAECSPEPPKSSRRMLASPSSAAAAASLASTRVSGCASAKTLASPFCTRARFVPFPLLRARLGSAPAGRSAASGRSRAVALGRSRSAAFVDTAFGDVVVAPMSVRSARAPVVAVPGDVCGGAAPPAVLSRCAAGALVLASNGWPDCEVLAVLPRAAGEAAGEWRCGCGLGPAASPGAPTGRFLDKRRHPSQQD